MRNVSIPPERLSFSIALVCLPTTWNINCSYIFALRPNLVAQLFPLENKHNAFVSDFFLRCRACVIGDVATCALLLSMGADPHALGDQAIQSARKGVLTGHQMVVRLLFKYMGTI
jgi:hypothetical protein